MNLLSFFWLKKPPYRTSLPYLIYAGFLILLLVCTQCSIFFGQKRLETKVSDWGQIDGIRLGIKESKPVWEIIFFPDQSPPQISGTIFWGENCNQGSGQGCIESSVPMILLSTIVKTKLVSDPVDLPSLRKLLEMGDQDKTAQVPIRVAIRDGRGGERIYLLILEITPEKKESFRKKFSL
jgi:hypothetical protein